MENQLAPVILIFFNISLLKSLNLILILGAKSDGHRGTWIGCSGIFCFYGRQILVGGYLQIFWRTHFALFKIFWKFQGLLNGNIEEKRAENTYDQLFLLHFFMESLGKQALNFLG